MECWCTTIWLCTTPPCGIIAALSILFSCFYPCDRSSEKYYLNRNNVALPDPPADTYTSLQEDTDRNRLSHRCVSCATASNQRDLPRCFRSNDSRPKAIQMRAVAKRTRTPPKPQPRQLLARHRGMFSFKNYWNGQDREQSVRTLRVLLPPTVAMGPLGIRHVLVVSGWRMGSVSRTSLRRPGM